MCERVIKYRTLDLVVVVLFYAWVEF